MKQKKLDTINSSGFKVPKDYFSQVEEQILSEVHLKSKVEASGFHVPDSYFETLENSIFQKIEKKDDAKVISIFDWKKTLYISAIAASLVLMFNVFFTSETITFDSIEIATIENYLEDEDFTSSDFASLLTYEELNKDNFIENEIPEYLIEDYLMNTIELEDLISE